MSREAVDPTVEEAINEVHEHAEAFADWLQEQQIIEGMIIKWGDGVRFDVRESSEGVTATVTVNLCERVSNVD